MPGLNVDRVGLIILLVATVIGLWLGLAGPDQTPVAPPGPPAPVVGTVSGFVSALTGGGVAA